MANGNDAGGGLCTVWRPPIIFPNFMPSRFYRSRVRFCNESTFLYIRLYGTLVPHLFLETTLPGLYLTLSNFLTICKSNGRLGLHCQLPVCLCIETGCFLHPILHDMRYDDVRRPQPDGTKDYCSRCSSVPTDAGRTALQRAREEKAVGCSVAPTLQSAEGQNILRL